MSAVAQTPAGARTHATFYATLLVTRAEEWWIEAETAEEAQALLASGQGHHAALGERVHVELEEMLEESRASALLVSSPEALSNGFRLPAISA